MGAMQFDKLYDIAVERKGESELEASLPTHSTEAELRALPNDRYLSKMAEFIFKAGFVWRVVNQKWPGFEEAFYGFDPDRLLLLDDEELDRLSGDTRIIRNWPKIEATIGNAAFVQSVAQSHGSFGDFIADWPSDDIIGLLAHLKKHGKRLGGMTGQYFLRFTGKDTFILSRDVVTSLIAHGVVDKAPTSKRDLATVQQTFNDWAADSGRPLCHISKILACTVESEVPDAVM